jgi:hypothetical protein
VTAEDLIIAARKVDPRVIETVRDPQFDDAPGGDWRAYVPDPVRKLWGRLSLEARIVAFMVASAQAEERDV